MTSHEPCAICHAAFASPSDETTLKMKRVIALWDLRAKNSSSGLSTNVYVNQDPPLPVLRLVPFPPRVNYALGNRIADSLETQNPDAQVGVIPTTTLASGDSPRASEMK